MIIVQNKRDRFCVSVCELVDEFCEDCLEIALTRGRLKLYACHLQRSDQSVDKADRVIIVRIQRKPGNLAFTRSKPFQCERGFARASRHRDYCQRARARHNWLAQSRRAKFGLWDGHSKLAGYASLA